MQLRLMLEYMGVDFDKECTDKATLATEVLRQRQVQAIARHGDGSKGELTRKLRKDEARVMQRDVGELRALLEYMDVECDPTIESKTRLVALIINQKRLGDAATSAQRVYRRASSHRASSRSFEGAGGDADGGDASASGPPVQLS